MRATIIPFDEYDNEYNKKRWDSKLEQLISLLQSSPNKCNET